MDIAKLERGKKIQDSLRENQRIIDFFTARENAEPIDRLCDFLKSAQNVGSSGIKKQAAIDCIEFIKEQYKNVNNKLQEEFDAL